MDGDDEQDLGPAEVSRRSLTTFPFSKTTCVCNCGKYNLQDLPRLRKILPEDYEYKLCEYLPLDREDKFLVTLRMTLSTREEALEWKRRFEERSLTTHVKDKTFPKVGRVSIFKAQYRCQFFDRRKNKKKLPEKSKFRDCRSILFMNIKKYFKNTVDRHMPAYQMVVRLHYAHNHPLDTADVLKKRQLNEDIKCRFLEMFRQGMKPKDALDKHKRELLQNLGPEKYRQVVCDGYYVPNVPKAYRLYYQIHGKGVSAKTTTKRSSRHNPNPDWIAFQNFPDAVTADNDEDSDYKDVGGSELPDDSNEAAVVKKSGDVDTGQEHNLTADSSCQRIVGQVNNMILASGKTDRDTILPRNLPDAQSLDSKLVANEVISHCMIPLDGQLKKTHPPHNSPYSNARGHHLPAQAMSVSSFGDVHLGMGLFNLTQPTWDTFHIPHPQSIIPAGQQSHDPTFPSLEHQNPTTMYILPNSDCQIAGTLFASSQGMIDHSMELQNRPPRTDLNINGSNLAQSYPWTHSEPEYNVDMPHTFTHLHQIRRDQNLSPKQAPELSQVARKLPAKKGVQKKKKRAIREVNMKRVTKRWMDKKPKVEAETQNLASEVLQTILLAEEAEKLKTRLLDFLSGLELKLVSNPKLFVPAVRQFLHASEGTEDDCKFASYLKDFGKTEENIIKQLEAKRKESSEARSIQTKLSGPVFKLGKAKPWKRNNKLSKVKAKSNILISTCGILQKSCSVAKVKNSNLVSKVKKKLTSNLITNSLLVTDKVLKTSDLISVSSSCPSEPKCGRDLNDKNLPNYFTRRSNHADGFQSNSCKQLKHSAAKTVREIKDKNISTPKHKKRCRHKTENTFDPENLTKLLKVSGDVSHISGAVSKNLIVKFTRIKQTVEQGKR